MTTPERSRGTIGVVVPGLDISGGVATVADFVVRTVENSSEWDLRLVSLAMSSVDTESTSLRNPQSWSRGVRSQEGTWRGHSFVHVGASWTDFEFQRYRGRPRLREALEGCDVIQVVAGTPAWATSVLDLGVPVSLQVATLTRVERRWRDANARGVLGRWRQAMTSVADRLDGRALEQVAAVQVENPWMLDHVREATEGRSIDVRYAPPGIDASFFTPDPAPPRPDVPYVLSVGRFADPRKRVGLLVHSLHRLVSEGHDIRLVLAGKAPPDNEIWRSAEALGVRDRIEFVAGPSAEELLKLYQGAAAFALGSDEEGLCMAVLEAMACAIPVVSTRCGGPEGVITDGEDGFLVPRGDSDAIAEGLAKVLGDPTRRDEMARAARAVIDERFDFPSAAQPFLEVWNDLRGNG